ncbi:MAG TPA: RluA family pseudouridine synthase [Clostridia bacterium]|nr:RluA family pseudouridine synthase [Clostridia bacterium]
MAIQIQVTTEYAGMRLDALISAVSDPPMSRNAVQLLCEQRLVLCNGAVAGKSLKVKAGDIVEFSEPEPVKLDAFPENIPINIVYEDDHLLVIDKPQGMVVHPAAGNLSGTLVNAVLYHCAGRLSSINGVIRPGIVHRIDKDTSGLLVIAKDNATHEGLSAQFAEHSIDRFYFAVVHGRVKEEQGRIEKPIGRHPVDRKKMCIIEKNSRYAATNYEVVERFAQFTLLRCQLETGRTHQIRVHMAAIGHPVAGDAVYGPVKRVPLPGQCLHAAVLGFIHPITGEHLIFESPLPQYFSDFIDKLRRSTN